MSTKTPKSKRQLRSQSWFGRDDYDEATIEYYLSRLFRIRASFSDAQALASRSFFRRVERAGIDLLLYFSF